MDRATATEAAATTIFGAKKTQTIAQYPQQRGAFPYLDRPGFLIDSQGIGSQYSPHQALRSRSRRALRAPMSGAKNSASRWRVSSVIASRRGAV